MPRSTFILLVSLYGLLIVIGMLVAPEAMLQVYGIPIIDKFHIALYQFLGMPILGLSVIGLLIRNAEPSLGLRAYLTGHATNILCFVALSVYQVTVRGLPASTFFTVDSLWRLGLGLGLVYYLTRLKPGHN